MCYTPRRVPLEQLHFATSTQWAGMVTGLWITWEGQSSRQVREKTRDKGRSPEIRAGLMGAQVHDWSGIAIYQQVLSLSVRGKSSTDRPGAAIQSSHPHGTGDSERVGGGWASLIQIIAYRLAQLGKLRKSCPWLCGASAKRNNIDSHLQCGGAAWLCRSSWPWLVLSLLYHDSSLFRHFVCDICKKDYFSNTFIVTLWIKREQSFYH